MRYIKAAIDQNPFLDLPLSERPEIVSGCTLLFSVNKSGQPFILAGQLNYIKAAKLRYLKTDTEKSNVWDLSGGGLHPGESYVLGATREFSEEFGLLDKHTERLPYKIFKLFTEKGKPKAKVIFLRFFDCYSLLNYPKEFIYRCHMIINELDNRFEYTRIGMLSLDEFFAQIAINDKHHPEMPAAEFKFISPWIVPEPLSLPDNKNRWRQAVKRIYNDPQMKEYVCELIENI